MMKMALRWLHFRSRAFWLFVCLVSSRRACKIVNMICFQVLYTGLIIGMCEEAHVSLVVPGIRNVPSTSSLFHIALSLIET
jgi:hypothetical protein